MKSLFGMDEALFAKYIEATVAGDALMQDLVFQGTKFGKALSASGWYSPHPLEYEKFGIRIDIVHMESRICACVSGDAVRKIMYYEKTDDEWFEWLTKVELREGIDD